ncbi:WD domain, G-beta repeat [Aquisphaera giovannonii]|uniref:WD domain, G-beta repeat n=1 Tax=Aquisphaera giovannonii TaxID=406548 RepID=A0A5B9VZY8_9BACT|nr:caspase family protein [Aquisphaera giovannonii]QEH33813.1 WD domain, G-beta repeat [Aquisphaera giovannonii]
MNTRAILSGGLLVTAAVAAAMTLRAGADDAAPGRPPQVWAVVVGIGKYSDPAIPEHRSAPTQAAQMVQWFRQAGWDERHQLLLQDFGTGDPGTVEHPSSSILPNRKNMDWAADEWLSAHAKAGDLVVVHFAGQAAGTVSRKTPRSEPIVEHVLLPSDAVRSDAATTGWSLDRVVDRCALRKIRVVCWLGTGVGPGPGPAPSPRDAQAMPDTEARDWLRRLTRWPGVTAWLASDRPMGFGQAADPSVAFTEALLKGLGDSSRHPNLAETLGEMERDAPLANQGFQSAGRVPPDLNLWAQEFGRVTKPPPPEMLLQTGHARAITALACTADKGMVFSASMDSTVRAWSLANGAVLNVWAGQMVGATTLGLSRGDRRLAIGGGRGTLQVAELPRFNVVLPPRPPHERRVEGMAMLPDGESVVTIDRDGHAVLTRMNTAPLASRPWPDTDTRVRDVASGGPAGLGVVAALLDDGSVRLFDAKGEGGRTVDLAGRTAAAIGLDPGGRTLAVGDAPGRVLLIDLASNGRERLEVRKEEIGLLRPSSTGWLLIGDGRGLQLASPARGEAGRHVVELVDRTVASTCLSANGRYLAAAEAGTGAVRVWRLDGGEAPRLVHSDNEAKAAVVALSGDGDLLIVGGQDGRVAAIQVEPSDRGIAARSWSIPASSGKVTQVTASASRRSLLVIAETTGAMLWDLKERVCRRVPGPWKSGAIVDDDVMVLAGASANRAAAGKLVRVRRDRDRSRFDLDTGHFARARGAYSIPPRMMFEGVIVSPDRKSVAATANPGQPPLVCVWDAQSGELRNWIRKLDGPVVSIDFSTDGKRIATGGNASSARLWNLAEPGEINAPEFVFEDPNAGTAKVTCVAIRPGRNQLATGRQDGQVDLWSWEGGKARLEVPRLVELFFTGRASALAFVDGGAKLAAGGDGTSIWLGKVDGEPAAIDDLNALRPHHLEQVNGLAAWPGTPVLISASDDTTVRFWDLKEKSLWGTFTASVPKAAAKGGPEPAVEWVFYTPDGFFDASTGGQRLVQFRRGSRVDSMERYEETNYRFGLGESLLVGQAPRAEPLDEATPVSILEPSRPDPSLEKTTLQVTLGEGPWSDVVLYHNDRPIPTGLDRSKKIPDHFTVEVRLVKGENRFNVAASRGGVYPSVSDPVRLVFDGPADPGRVHVIALGVGDYRRRQLKYARTDAQSIAEVLRQRGIDSAGKPGIRTFLPDDKVTPDGVEAAFDDVAIAVADRPQDKVVVFLAGHTGVFEKDRFCLLLPKYPFPEEEPELVAMRGDAPKSLGDAPLDPDAVLPYSSIALNLARLNALDRLVVVDACQAQSILNDPQVVQIQKWMEIQNRKSRTTYLLAARRNEPAFEVDPLRHGLFTYTLLRGLGEIDPADDPDEIRKLRLPANADRNGDEVLSTDELMTFVDDHIKEISRVFPQIVATREASLPAGRPRTDPLRLVQNPLLQSFGAPFPLVPLGRPAPAKAPGGGQ